MNRHRTLLSVLLGLMLLVQGYAASATTQPPCHGQAATSAEGHGAPAGDCCKSHCPDMASCAQGAMAAPAAFSLAIASAVQAQPSFAPMRVLTRASTLPLRPPITLHG
jgi:hypothetical protein